MVMATDMVQLPRSQGRWSLRRLLLLAALAPAAVTTVDPSPPERLRPEDDAGWANQILEVTDIA
eukprot:COSAG06_NODE_2139_length_7500_cov_3.787867_7_plen_64_part_00